MELFAERQQAFGYWMRTGRLPPVRTVDGIEFKFNPHHDPHAGSHQDRLGVVRRLTAIRIAPTLRNRRAKDSGQRPNAATAVPSRIR